MGLHRLGCLARGPQPGGGTDRLADLEPEPDPQGRLGGPDAGGVARRDDPGDRPTDPARFTPCQAGWRKANDIPRWGSRTRTPLDSTDRDPPDSVPNRSDPARSTRAIRPAGRPARRPSPAG